MTLSQREYRAHAASVTDPTRDRQPMTLTSSSIRSSSVALVPGAREQRWFQERKAEMIALYGGRWIAVSGDTVMGTGDDALEAHEQAKSRGFANAALILVPRREGEWDDLIV